MKVHYGEAQDAMLHATPTKSAERGQRLQGLERECDMGARVERESSPEQQRQGLEMETCKMKHETRSGKRQENAQRLHIHVGIVSAWTACACIFFLHIPEPLILSEPSDFRDSWLDSMAIGPRRVGSWRVSTSE